MEEVQNKILKENVDIENERKKEQKRAKRTEFWHENIRWIYYVLAVAFTGLLAFFDYLSVKEVFTRSSLSPANTINFAVLFAFGLEGIPFFTASFVSKALLEYKVKKNDELYAWIGVVLGIIGLAMAWIVAIYIRYILIQKSGGKAQYLYLTVNGVPEYNPDLREYKSYTADIFLLWSPIITSILAFLVSWKVTAWDIETQLKKEVEFYHKKFLSKEASYRMEVEKLLNLRVALWNAVTEYEADADSVFDDEQVFREEVIKRIRRHLILSSITVYPSEVERFQNKIEVELGSYLSELAIHSTQPELLLKIDMKELLQRYDDEQLQRGKTEMCWDYSKAGKALEDELKNYIGNSKTQIHSTFGWGGN